MIQFHSIYVFDTMYFFYFKASEMLELQKILLIVRFFNWISCNKGLIKGQKFMFFLMFFLFTSRPHPPSTSPEAGMF